VTIITPTHRQPDQCSLPHLLSSDIDHGILRLDFTAGNHDENKALDGYVKSARLGKWVSVFASQNDASESRIPGPEVWRGNFAGCRENDRVPAERSKVAGQTLLMISKLLQRHINTTSTRTINPRNDLLQKSRPRNSVKMERNHSKLCASARSGLVFPFFWKKKLLLDFLFRFP
jgi:hypothetical protein